MNSTEQIIELAKLDGCEIYNLTPVQLNMMCNGLGVSKDAEKVKPEDLKEVPLFVKPYLTSRDAIIPLVEKQSKEILYRIIDFICVSSDTYVTAIAILLAPPELLAEALLRATGKWKETNEQK